MKKASFGTILFIVVFLLGCTGQLAVEQITAEPSSVAPGEEAKIFVVLKGPKDKAASVTATVRKYTDYSFSLNDDGVNGDEKAGDNIWTYKITIPWEAPADTYHIDISVRDNEGHVIITKGFEKQSTGRSGTTELIVK